MGIFSFVFHLFSPPPLRHLLYSNKVWRFQQTFWNLHKLHIDGLLGPFPVVSRTCLYESVGVAMARCMLHLCAAPASQSGCVQEQQLPVTRGYRENPAVAVVVPPIAGQEGPSLLPEYFPGSFSDV